MMIDTELSLMDDIDLDNPISPNCGLNRGLAAWWKVIPGRNGGSRWWDLLKRNPGILTGMTSTGGWGGSPAPGGFGSLRFDGTDDAIYLAKASITFAQPFTFAAWVYYTSTSRMALYAVDTDTAGAQPFVTFEINSFEGGAGTFGYRIIATAANTGYASGMTINAWNHVSLVHNSTGATDFSIYINGQSKSVTTSTTGVIGTSPTALATIGSRRFAGSPLALTGQVESTAIGSRALSAAEAAWGYRDSLLGCLETLNRLGGSLSAAQQALLLARRRRMMLAA